MVTLDYPDGTSNRAVFADREEVIAAMRGMDGLLMKLAQKDGPASITVTTSRHTSALLDPIYKRTKA